LSGERRLSLICRVGARLCALPLEHVVETMRPLPAEPLPGVPGFIRGVSVIRGEATPVVDAAVLLGAENAHPQPGRLVTVRIGDRRVALAVDAVLGVQAIPDESVHDLVPLLKQASTEVISAIGMLDADLLLVLQSAQLVPEPVWALLEEATSST
jgi:purine-binding chemotaxis protein CheW